MIATRLRQLGMLLFSMLLCAVLGALFRKKGWIKDGDLKLD